MSTRSPDKLDDVFLNARLHTHIANLEPAFLYRIGRERHDLHLFEPARVETTVPSGHDLRFFVRFRVVDQDLHQKAV